MAAATRIFTTFMEPNQPMQINTKAEYLQLDREALAELRSDLFEKSYQEIYSMLSVLYNQFETDEIYQIMVSELTVSDNSREGLSQNKTMTAYGSIYPLRAYHTVLDRVSFALDSVESFYEVALVSKRSSVHRRRILRRAVHNFCEQHLQMDFSDNRVTQSMLTEVSTASDHRASLLSTISNTTQSNASMSSLRRKDALDFF